MAKIKVKVPLVQLSDVDVDWVSAVNRPANRIPFRIVKDEESSTGANNGAESVGNSGGKLMKLKVKLAEMLGGSNSAPVEAALAAIVIRKNDSKVLIPALTEAGYATEDMLESDEHYVLKQTEFDPADTVAFKVNDQFGVLVSGVTKSFSPFVSSMSFAEVMSAGGFFPSLMVASEAMQDTIRTVLFSSEDSSDASSKIANVVKDFGAFVAILASDLPEVAFKSMPDLNDISIKSTAIKEESGPTTGDINTGIGADSKGEGGTVIKSSADLTKKATIPEIELETTKKGGDMTTASDTATETATKEDPTDTVQLTIEEHEGSKYIVCDDGEKFLVEKQDDEAVFFYDHTDPDYLRAVEDAKALKGIHVEGGGVKNPEPPLKTIAMKKASVEQGSDADKDAETVTKDEGDKGGDTTPSDPTLTTILKAVEALTDGLKDTRKEITALGQRVAAHEKETEKSLKGTVLSGGETQDGVVRANGRVKKDNDLWAGTALDRIL